MRRYPLNKSIEINQQKLVSSNRLNIKKVFLSESFLEKAILLILTAIITGYLIPSISLTNTKKEIVLNNQSKLLDDVSATILTYETLLLDISWFKSNKQVYNPTMQSKAFDRYLERSVDLLSQWRTQIVKAHNFGAKAVSDSLLRFQIKMFNIQDTPTNALMNDSTATIDAWNELHNINVNMLAEAFKLISRLAIDLKIAKIDSITIDISPITNDTIASTITRTP